MDLMGLDEARTVFQCLGMYVPASIQQSKFGYWYPRFWSRLDRLVQAVASLPVIGIQEKFLDVGSPSKLLSLTTELRFAALFGRVHAVEMLSDGWGSAASPDLRVLCGGESLLVEVARLGDDETLAYVAELVQRVLDDESYGVVVEVQLDDQLSTPVLSGRSRAQKESEIKESLSQIVERGDLEAVDRTEVRVGGVTLSVRRSSGRGYVQQVSTTTHRVPDDEYRDKIRSVLGKKAIKRDSWTGEDRCLRYVVCLELDHRIAIAGIVESALFGEFCSVGTINRVPADRREEWDEYLRGHNLRSDEFQVRLEKQGCFLFDPRMRNVTAVGVVSHGGSRARLFGNPFAHSQINDPGIRDELMGARTTLCGGRRSTKR